MRVKKFISVILVSVAFCLVFNVAKAATVEELWAQIIKLQEQIAQLQKQLAELQGKPAAWCHDFNVDLKYGDAGNEVEALQIALEKEGLYTKGTNPPHFDESLASAVVGFQEKYKDEILTPWRLTHGTGFVGRATRAKLNKLYGCGVVPHPACTDTDGGANIYVKGITKLGNETYTDYCVNENTVAEYWCSGMGGAEWIAREEYKCPSRCKDGACSEIPPETWQEHWFEHNQILKLKYYDNNVAVYFDDDMNEIEASWQYSYISQIVDYVKRTYGNIYSDRLYAIYHKGKYYGGHPSYYYDSSHDYRNVIDCGSNDWSQENQWAKDGPSHEISHIVESTVHGKKGSPAFGIWKDSKWAEFFQYDLYLGIGMKSDAQRLYNQFMNTTDNFPRSDTHWFRDWFYPLWQNYGGAKVMKNFFSLISKYWPVDSNGYTRDMNWGEFVHFMSGAAGKDLRNLASNAFGWPTEWENQFQKARIDFPEVTKLY
jgi:hypothetical protein